MLIVFQNCFNFTYSSSRTLSDTYLIKKISLCTLLAVERKVRYEVGTVVLLNVHVFYNFRPFQLLFVNIVESYCLYLRARLTYNILYLNDKTNKCIFINIFINKLLLILMHVCGTHKLTQNFYFAYSSDQWRYFPTIVKYEEFFTI